MVHCVACGRLIRGDQVCAHCGCFNDVPESNGRTLGEIRAEGRTRRGRQEAGDWVARTRGLR